MDLLHAHKPTTSKSTIVYDEAFVSNGLDFSWSMKNILTIFLASLHTDHDDIIHHTEWNSHTEIVGINMGTFKHSERSKLYLNLINWCIGTNLSKKLQFDIVFMWESYNTANKTNLWYGRNITNKYFIHEQESKRRYIQLFVLGVYILCERFHRPAR